MAYGKIKLWQEPDENGDFTPLTEKQKLRLADRSFNYCVWSLGKSAKTVKQLTDKMKQKNCPEDIMDATIARLMEYNYVNDDEFTKSFVESRRTMGWGDRKISMELNKRGIPQELSREVIEEPREEHEETEYERAYRFAEKKVRSLNSTLDKRKKVERIVSAMVRRGFPMGICFEIANTLLSEDEAEEG